MMESKQSASTPDVVLVGTAYRPSSIVRPDLLGCMHRAIGLGTSRHENAPTPALSSQPAVDAMMASKPKGSDGRLVSQLPFGEPSVERGHDRPRPPHVEQSQWRRCLDAASDIRSILYEQICSPARRQHRRFPCTGPFTSRLPRQSISANVAVRSNSSGARPVTRRDSRPPLVGQAATHCYLPRGAACKEATIKENTQQGPTRARKPCIGGSTRVPSAEDVRGDA